MSTATEYLPASVLTKKQVKTYGWTTFSDGAQRCRIRAEVRHDDSCGNGYNSFAVVGEIQENRGGRWRDLSSGMIHDDIARHFPQLAPVLMWHLCGANGPMHYIANTLFLAGDRDCHGLRKGEFKQFRDPETGLPLWEPSVKELGTYTALVISHEKPAPIQVEYRPWGRTGVGKERELDAARRSAIWPEVSDMDLRMMSDADALEETLRTRLPALMREFKAAVESLGLVY